MEHQLHNNIFEFLKTGIIYGIKVGLAKDELLTIYKDELVFSFSNDICDAYFLDIVEIQFYGGYVQNINISGWQLKDIFISINEFRYNIKRKLSLNRLIFALNTLGLIWHFDKKLIGDKSICIVTEGGVNILLDFSEGYCVVDRIII